MSVRQKMIMLLTIVLTFAAGIATRLVKPTLTVEATGCTCNGSSGCTDVSPGTTCQNGCGAGKSQTCESSPSQGCYWSPCS